MYITETNDLFIVMKHKNKYILQHIDLDESNIMEFSGDRENFKDQFKSMKKFSYTEKDVNGKQLTKLHARGSSVKENIDI